MADVDFQQLSSVQSSNSPASRPQTIASAATIAPTGFHTFVSGTVQVATVTPFVSGTHLIFLTFTNAAPGALLTSGNLITAYQPIQNRPIGFLWDPVGAKYYQLAVV